MKCDFPIESLSAYLDEELNEQERKTVERHLAGCPRCREALNALRALDDGVRQDVYEEPSPEFILTLNRRIRDRIAPAPKRHLVRFAPVFAPVAAAIVIFIVLTDASASRKMMSISDRVAYEELAPRQTVQVSVPEPEKVLAAKPATRLRTAAPRSAGAPLQEAEMKSEAATELVRDAADVIAPAAARAQREGVVRAIIDTTGTIIKVATGNTIIPEEDTILEKELAGQRVSPATIEGKKAQIYVDFSADAEQEPEE